MYHRVRKAVHNKKSTESLPIRKKDIYEFEVDEILERMHGVKDPHTLGKIIFEVFYDYADIHSDRSIEECMEIADDILKDIYY